MEPSATRRSPVLAGDRFTSSPPSAPTHDGAAQSSRFRGWRSGFMVYGAGSDFPTEMLRTNSIAAGFGIWGLGFRVRAKRARIETFQGLLPESQGQALALTVLAAIPRGVLFRSHPFVV